MATIYNSDLTKELVDGAKIQISKDTIPSQLAEKVVPVMEVNPKLLKTINVVKHGTAGTYYTTPTNADFYLVGFNHSACSTAAGTNVDGISAIPFGEATAIVFDRLIMLNTVTVDAVSATNSAMYPIPIKLARGSTIVASSSGTVSSRSVTIFGYIDYTSNA